MDLSKTKTNNFWEGEGGDSYTNRNAQSVEELNQRYLKEYGIPRTAMNEEFLGDLDRSLKILEVGANMGLQLELLRGMGFTNLCGIEINEHAVLRAKAIHPRVDIIKGSAFDLPFRDKYFDLVFTSGVLIHVPSGGRLEDVLREINRVSGRYIWGFEYYAPTFTEVNYRGQDGLLWKTDFVELYLKTFPRLRLIKEKKYELLGSENISQMFLLEK